MWSALVRTGVEWVKMNDRSCHYEESRTCTRNYEKKQCVFRALRQDESARKFWFLPVGMSWTFPRKYEHEANLKGQTRVSLVALTVKNLPAMQKTWVWSLGREDPLEKGMATHSSILSWRFPWTQEPGGLQSMGLQSFPWPSDQSGKHTSIMWHHFISS